MDNLVLLPGRDWSENALEEGLIVNLLTRDHSWSENVDLNLFYSVRSGGDLNNEHLNCTHSLVLECQSPTHSVLKPE